MKKIYLFLVYFVIGYYINAQSIPITKYWGSLSIGGYSSDIIEVNNNNYFIIANRANNNLHSNIENVILKTDSNCIVIDSFPINNYHKKNKKYILNKFCFLKQKIIGTGYSYDSISKIKQIWISEFNSSLNIIRDTLLGDFDSTFNIYTTYPLVGSQNNLLLAVPNENAMFSDSSNTFLCLIDSNFSILTYNSIFTRFGYGLSLIEIVPKNVFHIVSIEKILEINPDNLSVDSAVWTQDTNSAFISGSGVKALNDSTYIHPGTYPFMKYYFNGFGLNTLIYIHNKNGKAIDSITIGDMQIQYTMTSGENIDFTTTDSIFITGTNYSLDSMSFLCREDNTIFLWNIKLNGQINWQKYYGLGKKFFVSGITKTSDGGCFLTGYMWDWHSYTDFYTDIFFLKVDRNGNVTGSVGINEKITQSDIRVYPNPAKNYINFDTGLYKDFKLNVYSSLGQNVLQQNTTDGNNSINISSFKQGIYFYKLTDKNGKTISGKFIKD